MNTPKALQGWRVDKTVPLAIIFTILAQAGIAIFWAGVMENRVTTLEREKQELRAALAEDRIALYEATRQLAIVAETLRTTTESFSRVERRLDALLDDRDR